MSNELVKMTIEIEVTKPQALALHAFFDKWNDLSNSNLSRFVGFYVDGKFGFKPNCKIKSNVSSEYEEHKNEYNKYSLIYQGLSYKKR